MNYLTLPSGYWPERASFPENSIFVFDFDGVLICQNEEKVFQLEAIEGERSRLEQLARIAGIDPELYDTPYLGTSSSKRATIASASRTSSPSSPAASTCHISC
jgi:hypothetical protein